MSQAALQIDNGAGAVVRGALNAALQAIITNNSGATAPTTTYPNMWWYDTANSQLKRRNNANDAWIVLGLEAADTDGTLAANSDTKVPTQKAAKTYADTKVPLTYLDTDGTLAANSDTKVPTQKAVKTLATTKFSKSIAGEIASISEKTTLVDDDLFIIEDSADSNNKKKVKKGNIATLPVEIYVADTNAQNLLISSDTARSFTAGTRGVMQILKQFTVPAGMSGSFYAWLAATSSGDDSFAAGIAVNGVNVASITVNGTNQKNVITGINPGDLIQAWCSITGGSGSDSMTLSNFRLYYNTIHLYTPTLSIDHSI